MNALKRQGKGQLKGKTAINAKYLNENQFTVSLMREGMRTGSINKEEMGYFQLQVMEILKDLIMRYTKGESTSVKVDTAESILNSLFYSIDAGIKSLSDPEDFFTIMKSGNVKQIYEKGLELVTACFKKSKVLYLSLRKNKLKVGLEAYDLTIDALSAFFDSYGPVFDAHNTMASIDYPLLFDDTSINGAFYIRNYIETLVLETKFCRLFPDKEIQKLLVTYGRIYKIDYTKTLTNIFELVVNASFFSVLSGSSAGSISMTQMQYEILRRKLIDKSSSALDLIIEETMGKVIDDLQIRNNKLVNYILKYKDILKTRLILASGTDSLKKLILLEDVMPVAGKKTVFMNGETMSNESFRELVDRMTSGIDSKAKISIIRKEINSLEDFIDILGGGCLFGDEYFDLFSQLSDDELGLLTGVLFSDEMRDGPINLSKVISIGIAVGEEWQELLVGFLGGLKSERVKSIETYMNDIISID